MTSESEGWREREREGEKEKGGLKERGGLLSPSSSRKTHDEDRFFPSVCAEESGLLPATYPRDIRRVFGYVPHPPPAKGNRSGLSEALGPKADQNRGFCGVAEGG